MKHIRILILPLVIMFSISESASNDGLSIMADYAAFFDPASQRPYIEVYYSVYRHQLGFIGSDTSNQAYSGVFAQVKISNTESGTIDSASTYFIVQMDDTLNSSDNLTRYFDNIPLQADPGSYSAEITVIDDVSKKIGVVEFPVDIPDFRRFEFFLSDIELAYEIQQIETENEAAVNSRLMKENRLVIPNPGRVFQAYQDSVINIYCELYGLSLDEKGKDEFIIEYKVKDATGSIIRDFGQMTYPRPGSTAVLSHTLNIRGLNPGEYYLTLRAIDPITYKEALSVKSFSLFDPISQVVVSGEEVDELANIAWYHLSEAEKIQIRKLSKQGQVNFLEQFWREMDDDPTTPENPMYKEAIRRFLYANEYFSTRGDIRDGWKTDRGRIYITYGPYDDKTDIALPGASMPLIKWEYYSLENGVIFIFSSEDVAGASDFRLVHSTHPHEIHDPTWVEKLEQESPEDNLQRQGDDFGW